ncbi:lysozyme inhibitor LprI family protein [Brevundimonas sp. PWP3-1b1]|uniref:lysozyme inhibitor LprI family protein n=1 Tax=unclassified Brevundimonas TaxID=2622653 RepID=UPI003CF6F259
MLFTIVSLLLVSQSPDHLPADCAKAQDTLAINACASRDLSREVERMDHYLVAARRNADAADQGAGKATVSLSQRAYLDQAQAAWTAYADLVCKGVYDKWNGGSIRNVAALRCRIDMTRERTHVVWRDYLTYADSTPPELPEPIRPASEELSYED